MRISRRTGIALLVIAALAGSATTAISALGHGGRVPIIRFHPRAHPVLITTLAPSVPTDPSLHTVAPGTAPWKLAFGAADLRSDGQLTVAIKGLLLTNTGNPALDNTTGPVMTVGASLYCGSDTKAAATTTAVPLSAKGNAFIHQKLALPAKCLAPALLINPNPPGGNGLYIAASGFPTS